MKKWLSPALLIATFALSAVAHYTHWNAIAQFVICAISVVFVAGFLGRATESVAHYAGQRLGGFLNATFGNAAELIIAIFLVKEGLYDMVKASLTGSIIGNLLLVLGASLFAGGLKYKVQNFNISLAGLSGSLMIVAVIALFVPAVFLNTHVITDSESDTLSLIVAGTLIVAYIAWLIFSMITHKDYLSDVTEQKDEELPHEHAPVWSRNKSIAYLILATVMVAFVSEWLVGTLEVFTTQFGLSELFVGAFLVAIIGNAAEHSAAILLAMKNKIGASVEIAVGSSLQIALFVAPVLIFVSYFMGNTMNIVFTTIELVAIAVAVFIAKSITQDGSTNWYEGLMLLVVYVLLGVSFFLV
ncbi:calcium/proton exchanger [Paenibacillus sp. SEL3]|uniref:Ca(2+)/H(+) antiporter n=1 Tax=Paenibacillus polymyxa TaxID=1406 RepID=A0A8I1ITC6_PAEPO|nr:MULTISPECIES: calcium/proton exchanger [Paenibacillus]KAF6569508.1 calcium/proton exchanger [Paenibacillus sp. EKM206P]KAF6589976.1 calcium/proton exchanger [Paenibacillus sp. EKM205P]MBM0632688.1 calcium/proton exchanger [Paenibacillus polymyxa]MBO3286557.1 calcium/proton exchanger [Paenibacillus polymyxa]MDY8093133.1 calcium/proton exchanger [Paenibacillus polymyxa]